MSQTDAHGSLTKAATVVAALLTALCGCTRKLPPADFVSLARVAPAIALDIRYAGPENFVGTPIDGYHAALCLLTPAAATALAEVDQDLGTRELGLIVFDCYRPQRAVDHFVRWAADLSDTRTRASYYPNEEKSMLFQRGYIAERSGHSRGSTVDLGVVQNAGGGTDPPRQLLDMGTRFDFFDTRSATESPEVTPEQRANRLLLRGAMEMHGFRNYPAEWWHYTLENEPYPDTYFDVPVE